MTYLGLGLLFVAVAVAVLVVAWWTVRPSRRWWLATVVTVVALVVLTVVFDSVMIAADLFRFDEAALTGLRLGLAPVEDLAWPVAAGLGLPALVALRAGRSAATSAASVGQATATNRTTAAEATGREA
ncbi:lycopene cyclase domain-containing protein [Georgenia sp. M64]|uniref:lycopene cyclase domain-containing protein n=1 Tax=Georgenia sp. M64 TaxID=3120520 RepID=UPI0030E01A84